MKTIRDIMEPNVFWLPDDMPLKLAAEMLSKNQIGGAPACDRQGKIVGMISKTDLADYYGGVNETRPVRDIMTPEVFSVAPDESVDRAVQLMAFEGIHRLLVLDGERLVGIVTTMDVLREMAGFPRRGRRVVAIAPPA